MSVAHDLDGNELPGAWDLPLENLDVSNSLLFENQMHFDYFKRLRKEAAAGVDKTIAAAERLRADSQANLGSYEEMFNTVQADPSKASEYLQKIGK